jgi:hypothetical protein
MERVGLGIKPAAEVITHTSSALGQDTEQGSRYRNAEDMDTGIYQEVCTALCSSQWYDVNRKQ